MPVFSVAAMAVTNLKPFLIRVGIFAGLAVIFAFLAGLLLGVLLTRESSAGMPAAPPSGATDATSSTAAPSGDGDGDGDSAGSGNGPVTPAAAGGEPLLDTAPPPAGGGASGGGASGGGASGGGASGGGPGDGDGAAGNGGDGGQAGGGNGGGQSAGGNAGGQPGSGTGNSGGGAASNGNGGGNGNGNGNGNGSGGAGGGSGGGGVTFAVQFGNFTDQAHANAMLSALQSDGIAARIVVETDVNNQRWYAVRTPPFVDQAAAELAAMRYRDRQGLSSLVMAQPGGGGNGS
jgi:hypothetical protein